MDKSDGNLGPGGEVGLGWLGSMVEDGGERGGGLYSCTVLRCRQIKVTLAEENGDERCWRKQTTGDVISSELSRRSLLGKL